MQNKASTVPLDRLDDHRKGFRVRFQSKIRARSPVELDSTRIWSLANRSGKMTNYRKEDPGKCPEVVSAARRL